MTDEKFECAYKQYRNMVMNAAYEILSDYHLAQDVCQEVFIKLSYDRLDRLKTDDDMRRYISSVACHRAIDYYRKIKRTNEVFLEDESDTLLEFDLDTKLSEDEFLIEMFRKLGEKKWEWREIVLRVGFYGEEPTLVARDLGVSIGNLRIMYHRAKEWLRKNFTCEFEYLKELL